MLIYLETDIVYFKTVHHGKTTESQYLNIFKQIADRLLQHSIRFIAFAVRQ